MKRNVLKAEAFVDDRGILRLPRQFINDAATLFTGKEVFLSLEERIEFRSQDANAYYWVAIVGPVCDRFNELGERLTKDVVHEVLKYKFLRVFDYDPVTGDPYVKYIQSTSKLKVPDFSFYLEDCIRFAAEDLDLPIEPPKKRREDFVFREYQRSNESRKTYLKRIESYVLELYNEADLLRYFRQNDDWADDLEIKAIFRDRTNSIKVPF